MRSSLRVSIVGQALTLLALAALGQGAEGRCRWWDPYLTCFAGNANFALRNLSVVLTERKPFPIMPVPPLPFVALPGINLLQVLPWNNLINLLHRTYPESEYGYACPVPLLKAWQVDEVRASPWSPHRATFEPCRLAPYFRSEVHSYVFGALADLSNVAYWHLAALPDLRFFKNTFSWLVGPRLGLCVAVNPCGGNNVFLGLQGLRSWHKFFVDCGHGTITLQIRPSSYFWSVSMGLNPPEWRSALPQAWGVDPADWQPAKAIGWRRSVIDLSGTTPTGSTFLQGELFGGLEVDFGGQTDAWAMVRSMERVALSMRLDTAPDLLLWNTISLPLRSLPEANSSIAIRRVDLTARAVDCHLWLSALGQTTVPAHLFVRHVPALGDLIRKFYQDADVESAKAITALYVHSHGNGVGVRLEFGPCSSQDGYKLTPAAAQIMRRSNIWGPFALTFKAIQDAPAFSNAVTVEYAGWAHAIWFCQAGWQCPNSPAACNTAAGVCNIASAQASSLANAGSTAAATDAAPPANTEAGSTSPAAADAGAGAATAEAPAGGSTAAAAAPGAAGVPGTAPAAPAAPVPPAVAAAAPAPEEQPLPTLNVTTDSFKPGLVMEVVQEECDEDEDCPQPDSRCMQDYDTAAFACVRWKK